MHRPFQIDEIENAVGAGRHFSGLGLATAAKARTLTFLDSEKFIGQLTDNPNISGVITTIDLSARIPDAIQVLVSEDPRYAFYALHNRLASRSDAGQSPTVIHPRANVHPTSFIAPRGVVIEADVLIEPHVSILEGVRIGRGSTIRTGARLGVEGFEHKRTSRGIVSVRHDGLVRIGKDVEVGPNNTVAKGLMDRDTVIGDQTKLDALVHIAHCVQIGSRCFIPACAMIAGSVTIGDDVWIGPNSSVSSQVKIDDKAFVTLGSVVTRDVQKNERVTGNFAVPHDLHMRTLRKQLREEGQSNE